MSRFDDGLLDVMKHKALIYSRSPTEAVPDSCLRCTRQEGKQSDLFSFFGSASSWSTYRTSSSPSQPVKASQQARIAAT